MHDKYTQKKKNSATIFLIKFFAELQQQILSRIHIKMLIHYKIEEKLNIAQFSFAIKKMKRQTFNAIYE